MRARVAYKDARLVMKAWNVANFHGYFPTFKDM